MSANVIQLNIASAAEERDERRYQSTLRNMAATTHAVGIEIQRVMTLGHADRVVALKSLQVSFASLNLRAASLVNESREHLDEAANVIAELESLDAAKYPLGQPVADALKSARKLCETATEKPDSPKEQA